MKYVCPEIFRLIAFLRDIAVPRAQALSHARGDEGSLSFTAIFFSDRVA